MVIQSGSGWRGTRSLPEFTRRANFRRPVRLGSSILRIETAAVAAAAWARCASGQGAE
jgi:hypothetical protein